MEFLENKSGSQIVGNSFNQIIMNIPSDMNGTSKLQASDRVTAFINRQQNTKAFKGRMRETLNQTQMKESAFTQVLTLTLTKALHYRMRVRADQEKERDMA